MPGEETTINRALVEDLGAIAYGELKAYELARADALVAALISGQQRRLRAAL